MNLRILEIFVHKCPVNRLGWTRRANVARRKDQQRSFFAEMEGNIRTKIGQGLLFGGATPPSMPSTPAGGKFAISMVAVRGLGCCRLTYHWQKNASKDGVPDERLLLRGKYGRFFEARGMGTYKWVRAVGMGGVVG